MLVAVSGGPDSMALLFVLDKLAKKFEWQIAVAHVNYQLRGKESEADALLVASTAEKLGLPFYLLKKRVRQGMSEDALREIRYAFFEKLVEKHSFDVVALAHHQDDQAETVLMRLIRGSGSLGLSGIRYQRGIYVRPFLNISKSELLAFLEQSDIPYRLDKSNTENTYFRNKVRNVLIPLLETYNPRIRKVLSDTAFTLQEEQSSKEGVSVLVATKNKSHVSFPLASWQAIPKESQVKALRELFSQNRLPLPTKSLSEALLSDLRMVRKKGSTKDFFREYARLSLTLNDGMIDIHFKELD